MAKLSDINSQLIMLVENALTAAGISGAEVGTEWPPTDVLQNAGKDTAPIIAILHKLTTYQSRNMRFQHSVTVNPVGIQSTLSDFSLAPGQSITLTLALASGSTQVNANDTVSCILSNGNSDNAATYSAPANGVTLNSVAAGLAAAIHTTFPFIAAVASGAVITLTNDDTQGYHVASYVGNTTNINEAVKWASRSMQINVWCGDLNTKFAIQEALEILLSQIDDAEGFALPSTEWIELKFHGAKPDDADTDKDVYTDFYLFTVDHMIDVPIEMWPVVAPFQQNYW